MKNNAETPGLFPKIGISTPTHVFDTKPAAFGSEFCSLWHGTANPWPVKKWWRTMPKPLCYFSEARHQHSHSCFCSPCCKWLVSFHFQKNSHLSMSCFAKLVQMKIVKILPQLHFFLSYFLHEYVVVLKYTYILAAAVRLLGAAVGLVVQ